MEFLSILYALLAALTGLSVGEPAPVRQPVAVSAMATAGAAAVVRKGPAAVVAMSRQVAQTLRHPRNDRALATNFVSIEQISVLFFSRRHE